MSAEPFALDTNVLVYAVDVGDRRKHERAQEVVRLAAATGRCRIPVQAVGEFLAAVTRRGIARSEAIARARAFQRLFATVPADASCAAWALDEVEAGRLSYWDALAIAPLPRTAARPYSPRTCRMARSTAACASSTRSLAKRCPQR